MSDNKEISSRSVLQDIVKWSADLPLWQRDALRRIYQNGKLTENDVNDLYRICKNIFLTDTNGKEASKAEPVEITHVPSESDTSKTVSLKCIKDVQHVNALVPEQKLSFRKEGLTIIFGNSGSGKSGYVRILKKACRSRYIEDILPNIHETTTGHATATIQYAIGGHDQLPFPWEDTQPSDEILSQISVFDSKCAPIHVEGLNELAYTPLPLEILSELAKACLAIRKKLKDDENKLANEIPPGLRSSKYHNGTKVAQLIESISAGTEIDYVESVAKLSEEEQKRISTLRNDLANDPSKLSKQLELRKNRLDGVRALITRLEDSLSDTSLNEYKELMIDAEKKAKAAYIAATQLFKDEPLSNVGSEIWRELWEAARKYSALEAYPQEPFPVTEYDSVCVLCQQLLSSKAIGRLKRFEDFVKADTQQASINAANLVDECRNLLLPLRLKTIQVTEIVGLIGDELEEQILSRKVNEFLRMARICCWLVLKIKSSEKWPNLPKLPESWIQDIKLLSDSLNKRISDLNQIAKSDDRKHQQQELNELEDRVWLSEVIDDVKAEIIRRTKLAVLSMAISDTGTDDITRKSSGVAEALVTAALRDKFSDEVNRLGAHPLRVELIRETSSYGVPHFRVVLVRQPDAKIGSILSEGEHRCIALAAFLSELATLGNRSGIVFDDPVSSLDHEYREALVKRLVQEASTSRQVIVFTHDIVFLFMLEHASREIRLEPLYQCVSRSVYGTGVCNPNPPFKAQPVKKAIESIEQHLSNVRYHHDVGNDEEWSRHVKSLGGQLRDCWELAAEETVSHVVRRFTHKVKIGNLIKLTVLTDKDCSEMTQGYDRCSELMHSESSAMGKPLPTPDKIQDEINALKVWIESVFERQKKIKP